MKHNYETQLNTLKEDYISQIDALMNECEDISLLDLIKKLLVKKLLEKSR